MRKPTKRSRHTSGSAAEVVTIEPGAEKLANILKKALNTPPFRRVGPAKRKTGRSAK